MRRIDVRGYRRHDGLYDIEARIIDAKSQALTLSSSGRRLAAGDPLHDMSIRMVVDEDLLIHDVIAVTDAAPHGICPQAAASIATLRGERIGRGFRRVIRERLSGAQGCTHLTELLVPLATTAFQTLSPLRNAGPDRLDDTGTPVKIDTCFAYGRSRDLVRQLWPAHHRAAGE